MKLKMLPNWCKKLGLGIFFTSFILTFTYVSIRESFIECYNSAGPTHKPVKELEPIFFEKILGTNSIHFLDILMIVGMIIYMFSKEKIEDDFINKLRLESYQLTAFIGLGITIVLYAFSEDLKITLDYFIIFFLWIFLIVFAIKKRSY